MQMYTNIHINININDKARSIAARKNFERAVGRPRPAPGLLTPGSRPPPRTSLVCSLIAPGALNSRVLLRIPIGSIDVGTTTTLLAARALPNNCRCVHPNCMLAFCQTRCRHPPKSYQNPRALQAKVHSFGVHSSTRI